MKSTALKDKFSNKAAAAGIAAMLTMIPVAANAANTTNINKDCPIQEAFIAAERPSTISEKAPYPVGIQVIPNTDMSGNPSQIMSILNEHAGSAVCAVDNQLSKTGKTQYVFYVNGIAVQFDIDGIKKSSVNIDELTEHKLLRKVVSVANVNRKAYELTTSNNTIARIENN